MNLNPFIVVLFRYRISFHIQNSRPVTHAKREKILRDGIPQQKKSMCGEKKNNSRWSFIWTLVCEIAFDANKLTSRFDDCIKREKILLDIAFTMKYSSQRNENSHIKSQGNVWNGIEESEKGEAISEETPALLSWGNFLTLHTNTANGERCEKLDFPVKKIFFFYDDENSGKTFESLRVAFEIFSVFEHCDARRGRNVNVFVGGRRHSLTMVNLLSLCWLTVVNDIVIKGHESWRQIGILYSQSSIQAFTEQLIPFTCHVTSSLWNEKTD